MSGVQKVLRGIVAGRFNPLRVVHVSFLRVWKGEEKGWVVFLLWGFLLWNITMVVGDNMLWNKDSFLYMGAVKHYPKWLENLLGYGFLAIVQSPVFLVLKYIWSRLKPYKNRKVAVCTLLALIAVFTVSVSVNSFVLIWGGHGRGDQEWYSMLGIIYGQLYFLVNSFPSY